MDVYLQKILKNWASAQRPPQNARARLLLTAADPSLPEQKMANTFYEGNYHSSSDFYSLHTHQPARNQDLIWVFHMPMPGLRMI